MSISTARRPDLAVARNRVPTPIGPSVIFSDCIIRGFVDRFVALVGDIVENLLDQPVDQDFAADSRLLSSPLLLGRRNDRIELVLQPAGQVVKVWTVIEINDQSDREHACVRQDVEVNSHVPALADSDRNGSSDLCPPSRTGSTGPRTRHQTQSGRDSFRLEGRLPRHRR
jgi:hypothetical protein